VHEIGHTVWRRIEAHQLAFQPEDEEAMRRLFTANAEVARAVSVIGRGYWSGYAASGAGEDFAETFAAYYTDGQELQRRSLTDALLARKLAFIRDRVDTPDPGPAVVTHPKRPGREHYVFVTRDVLRYKRHGAPAQDLPPISISRVQ